MPWTVLDALGDLLRECARGLDWALASDPCAALVSSRERSGPVHDAGAGRRPSPRAAGARALASLDRDRIRARTGAGGVLSLLFGDAHAAREELSAGAPELERRLGEPGAEAWSLSSRVSRRRLRARSGPLACSSRRAERFTASSSGAGEARATAALGLTMTSEHPVLARELIEEALALNEAAQDGWGQGQCHLYLDLLAEAGGASRKVAAGHYRLAMEHLRPYRGGPLLPVALIGGRASCAPAIRRRRCGSRLPPTASARVPAARSRPSSFSTPRRFACGPKPHSATRRRGSGRKGRASTWTMRSRSRSAVGDRPRSGPPGSARASSRSPPSSQRVCRTRRSRLASTSRCAPSKATCVTCWAMARARQPHAARDLGARADSVARA